MSRLVAFAAIQGAYNIVSKVEGKFQQAMDKYGPNQPLAFPNTAYYLPIIYSILGIKVEKLADAEPVLQRCKNLLPPHVKGKIHTPYLGHLSMPAWPPSWPKKWGKPFAMWTILTIICGRTLSQLHFSHKAGLACSAQRLTWELLLSRPSARA